MLNFLLVIFIFSFSLCVLTYIVYPLSIWFIGNITCIDLQHGDIEPSVSIIISAFNEEKDIKQKIKNTIALDYATDKREILIGSDGSTDNTIEIAKKYAGQGIKLFNFATNRGKTSVQNDLVQEASGEVLIFTDSASFLPKDALKKLVRNFADPRVGCVAGKMSFIETNQNITTQSQGLYWRYEMNIREMESRLGSLIGVDGPLYAVRRDCYIPLQSNIISDLMTPLLVLEQGKKVILEPEALVEEKPTQKGRHELNTRRRITLRGLVGIFSHPEVISPLKHPLLTLQIFSHKVIRWFVGPLTALNFISCSAILYYDIFFFRLIFSLYVMFFAAAGIGWLCEQSGKKIKLLTIPYYFCLVNLAATLGIIDFFMKKQAVTWKTVRN